MKQSLIELQEKGLYCPLGDFYIDPWKAVPRALLTHAHADHATAGSQFYVASTQSEPILRLRLGLDINLTPVAYGENLQLNRVKVSFHPAGHILGSAQIRVEHQGEVWVVSGDYKTEPDKTCVPFEPLRCHTYVTESTFGLPIYRWPAQEKIFSSIVDWWKENQENEKASILYAYALGKSQRVLAALDEKIGPIFTHGAVEKLNVVYRTAGIKMAETSHVGSADRKQPWKQALIIAPPSARGTAWVRKFGPASSGFVSGWMQIRGARRRRGVDRGFVLSDHADWPSLLNAIETSGAERVWVTHGYAAVLARWLREKGLDAKALSTRFEGEQDEKIGELAEETLEKP